MCITLSIFNALIYGPKQHGKSIFYIIGTHTNIITQEWRIQKKKYNQILTSNHAEDLVSSNAENPPLLFCVC
jgi:hypothetical protein